MANSLRAKFSKLRHDGHITDAEYQEFLKKLDGHDREIRNRAIDDMYIEVLNFEDYINPIAEENGLLLYSGREITKMVVEIAQQMKGE